MQKYNHKRTGVKEVKEPFYQKLKNEVEWTANMLCNPSEARCKMRTEKWQDWARELGTSASTLRKAMKELIAENRLSYIGKGYYNLIK